MKRTLGFLYKAAGNTFSQRTEFTQVVDGCHAAARVAYYLSEDSFIFPITPSTAMSQFADDFRAAGEVNVWDQEVNVYQMQSEAGVAGAVHGSLVGGGITTTFTASQGLVLMFPVMFKIAGELLPCVFHVASRGLAGQGLTIFGDHEDVMACRSTGFAYLNSHNVQECHDMALVAHLASLRSSVPFLHFFDGFRTSNELQKISMLDKEEIMSLVDPEDVLAFKKTGCTNENPKWRGTAQNPDIYFQMTEANQIYYDAVPTNVMDMMKKVGDVTGRHYNLFDYYGSPEAEHVAVVMGSASQVIEELIDHMGPSSKFGVIKPRLFRPWSSSHFLSSIPSTTKTLTVLDRVKESGSQAEPLLLDVTHSIQQSDEHNGLKVLGGRFGLGSKDFTPSNALSVFENAKSSAPVSDFTIGIHDDVTNLSLPSPSESISTSPLGTIGCQFWGIGGDGTVGANHRAIEIIGSNTPLSVQGYFEYDAKKAGGVTISHLRFGEEKIKGSYLVQDGQADYLACHCEAYVEKYPEKMLGSVKEGGTFVLNTGVNGKEELDNLLPEVMKRAIKDKKLEFYCVDGSGVAEGIGLQGRINMVMQTVFFYLSEVLDFEESKEMLEEAVREDYGVKGDKVVDMNLRAVKEAVNGLWKVEYDDQWGEDSSKEGVLVRTVKGMGRKEDRRFVDQVLDKVVKLRGDEIPISECVELKGGVFPMSMARLEKRAVAIHTPEWIPENCIQCNTCAFVCPHAVIRPFLFTEDEVKNAPEGMVTLESNDKRIKELGLSFRIQVSVMDCTGCMNCVENCPADALEPSLLSLGMDRGENDFWNYCTGIPHKGKDLPLEPNNVKGAGFLYPYLEFHGACAGCGEVTYMKILTMLFGQQMIVANASGCSSVWGGYAAASPYCTDEKGWGPTWANSLFEDNAEFGFGMTKSIRHTRERLRDTAERIITENSVEDGNLVKELKSWTENFDDKEGSLVHSENIKNLLSDVTEELDNNEDLQFIDNFSGLLSKKSHWIVGGDGWCYDVGLGGVLHVLKSQENLNFLIFDTEMYSNTGGQPSKASPLGAVMNFARRGKQYSKFNLTEVAMGMGDVYVASVSMGADRNQLLRALREAEAFDGPSFVVAFSPCIGWGVNGSMRFTQQEEKLAVECGYWPLFRFDPTEEKKLSVDYKKIDVEKLDVMVGNEQRFTTTQKNYPDEAKEFVKQLKEDIVKRHEHMLYLEKKYE